MHWLFSLKYWVIAREVPKLFNGGTVSFNENIYTVVNVAGMFINFVPIVMLSYVRGQLTIDSAGQVPSESIVDWVKYLYHIVTFLQLVSAIILADALRRIVASLRKNPVLSTNYRIMWLHITMLTLHVGIFTLVAYFVFRAFDNPTEKNKLLQSYSRIALFTSQTVVQCILIYIFVAVN